MAMAALLGKPNEKVFNRVCAAIALMFIIGTQTARWISYDRHGTSQHQDFPQYYMGGVIARNGAWDSLYPDSAADVGHESGACRKIPRSGQVMPNWKSVITKSVACATWSRRPQQSCFWPMSYVPSRWAHLVWLELLCLVTWGIGFQAARTYELCSGRRRAGSSVCLSQVHLCFATGKPMGSGGEYFANYRLAVGVCLFETRNRRRLDQACRSAGGWRGHKICYCGTRPRFIWRARDWRTLDLHARR